MIITSFLQADSMSLEQHEAYTKILKQKDMRPILLDLSRSDRKVVCLKIMNSKGDPMFSYNGANCLLYNGYGDLSIPFFTEFLYNGNNEKYLNSRMGYGWLHSADWYKVGASVLSKMTEHKPLHLWMKEKIQEEVLKHPSRYGEKALSNVIKKQFITYTKEHPLSNNDKKILKECKNIFISFNNYSCYFDKKTKKFQQCKKSIKLKMYSISCK